MTKFMHPISFRIPPSFSVCKGGSFRRFCSLKHNGRKFPTPLAFSGEGTGNGNGSGGIIGSNSGGGGSSGDGNEKESLMALLLPEMFLQVEISPFSRWLVQFEGIKLRLLADNLLLAKVAMECGVAMFTETAAAEYEKGKEKISKELEIVYADVGRAVNADFMLAYSPGTDNPIFADVLENNCCDKVVGTIKKNTLISAKKAVQNELKDIPRLSPVVGYSLYKVVSGNLRYQLLAGVVERRLRRRLSHKHKQMLSAACYVQVLVESQSDCWIPEKISFQVTGVVSLRNWCMSLMRSQGRYINEFRLV